ncbi:MAG: phage integrase N-terminal SAM-like domain-containing protein [Spirochaetaceae bacterium]
MAAKDLDGFVEHLRRTMGLKPRVIEWYERWVRRFAEFAVSRDISPWTEESLETFLDSLGGAEDHWQLQQARDAVERYRRYRLRGVGHGDGDQPIPETWDAAATILIEELRLRAKALPTEKTYVHWARDFAHFLSGKPPAKVEQADVRRYLTELAVTRGVASSTQKQAFIALLFLFRHVLHQSIDHLNETVRARRPRKLPVVLTRAEIGAVFAELKGTHLLMCRLIYGGGLRLTEGLRLRIKDIDIPGGAVTVRSGKSNKDRVTLLPSRLEPELNRHTAEVRRLFEEDRSLDRPGVPLPAALARKFKGADTEWGWYWLFRSTQLRHASD